MAKLDIRCAALPIAAASFLTMIAKANAEIAISTATTSNISCSGGVCAPTAKDAVLNVGDLETMLTSGSVTVTTTGDGVQAKDMKVKAALSWANSNTLFLDAFRSVTVDKTVSVTGAGGLSVTTNDGGKSGTLSFGMGGHVVFDFNNGLPGTLTIDGQGYTLVFTVTGLIASVAENPSGYFALANDYDASRDGTYRGAIVQTPLGGTFEGLGNAFRNLVVRNTENEGDGNFGLFSEVDGTVENLGVENIVIAAAPISITGSLTPVNVGLVRGDWASGKLSATSKGFEPTSNIGGIVGVNEGTIVNSHAAVDIGDHTQGAILGGLAAVDSGTVESSYATGSLRGGEVMVAGGLVGDVTQTGNTLGVIENSYATGALRGELDAEIGGLVGYISGGKITSCYATGSVSARKGLNVGGLLGTDETGGHSLSNDYWDTDTSGTDLGVGNDPHDSGVTGLTTAQLQSGLPKGFGAKIWREKTGIDGGLPYLIANPPSK